MFFSRSGPILIDFALKIAKATRQRLVASNFGYHEDQVMQRIGGETSTTNAGDDCFFKYLPRTRYEAKARVAHFILNYAHADPVSLSEIASESHDPE
jgi:hypothetical protein